VRIITLFKNEWHQGPQMARVAPMRNGGDARGSSWQTTCSIDAHCRGARHVNRVLPTAITTAALFQRKEYRVRDIDDSTECGESGAPHHRTVAARASYLEVCTKNMAVSAFTAATRLFLRAGHVWGPLKHAKMNLRDILVAKSGGGCSTARLF